MINSGCAGGKSVTARFLLDFACSEFFGNIGEIVGQEGKVCDEVETVREFTCVDERMSTG